MLSVLMLAGVVGIQAPVDSVDYPWLKKRGLRDCASTEAAQQSASDLSAVVCRERRPYQRSDVRVRLDAGAHAWRDDDVLTFACSGVAKGVSLAWRGVVPLARIVGTDLWVIRLRLTALDSAIVGYQFVVTPKASTPATGDAWRSAGAIPDPPASRRRMARSRMTRCAALRTAQRALRGSCVRSSAVAGSRRPSGAMPTRSRRACNARVRWSQRTHRLVHRTTPYGRHFCPLRYAVFTAPELPRAPSRLRTQ